MFWRHSTQANLSHKEKKTFTWIQKIEQRITPPTRTRNQSQTLQCHHQHCLVNFSMTTNPTRTLANRSYHIRCAQTCLLTRDCGGQETSRETQRRAKKSYQQYRYALGHDLLWHSASPWDEDEATRQQTDTDALHTTDSHILLDPQLNKKPTREDQHTNQ